MSTQEKSKAVVAKKQSEITAIVLKKVEAFQRTGELRLPKDYSPENALKSAQLMLVDMEANKQPVLEYCTKGSIANALLETVVLGLSPHKKQVYFIPYGRKLSCTVSYMGNIALAKRYGNLKTIKANCIMEGDDFDFEIDSSTGRRKITKHKQTLESIGSEKIKGAYAVYELNDGTVDVEVMNMVQIEKSWKQGAMNGNSGAHKNFSDQMANRTVINRACKLLVNSSDDAVLYDGDEENLDVTQENVKQDIDDNANQEVVDVDDYEVVDDEEVKSEPKEEQLRVEKEKPKSEPKKETKAESKQEQPTDGKMF